MDELAAPIAGGCLCGAIRYEAREPPSDANYCHCRMCQRTSGAPAVASVTFARQAFQFTKGEPKHYKSSSFAERGFCSDCGSSLTYIPLAPAWSGMIFVWTGTLDRPQDAPPKWHTGIESQVSWFNVEDDLPRLATEDNPDVSAIKEAADQDKG